MLRAEHFVLENKGLLDGKKWTPERKWQPQSITSFRLKKKEHHQPCRIYLTHLTDLCAKYSAHDLFSWSLLASKKIQKLD
jgi:hypothetical protein